MYSVALFSMCARDTCSIQTDIHTDHAHPLPGRMHSPSLHSEKEYSHEGYETSPLCGLFSCALGRCGVHVCPTVHPAKAINKGTRGWHAISGRRTNDTWRLLFIPLTSNPSGTPSLSTSISPSSLMTIEVSNCQKNHVFSVAALYTPPVNTSVNHLTIWSRGQLNENAIFIIPISGSNNKDSWRYFYVVKKLLSCPKMTIHNKTSLLHLKIIETNLFFLSLFLGFLDSFSSSLCRDKNTQ